MKKILLLCISLQMVFGSDMVIYWGQNSIATFTTDPAKQEKPLRTYCQDSTYDIIVVGFVYLFPTVGGSAFPGMNFANHCEEPFNQNDPFVLNCTGNVAPDIQYCQAQGKKIFLSFGGGVGQYGFSSDAQAVTFATTVWNMFLGGSASGVPRPFGNAIFDGIDLDIEGGSSTGYTAFINKLRTYFASSSRSYYISAAPQCFYPDRIGPGTGTPLSTAWFDYVWIQFYNNHCGVDEYPQNFNFPLWAAWALSNSVNPNVKLFIGAPASPKAAASGFVSLATLQTISNAMKTAYPSIYGGLMLWDACTSDDNSYFGTQVAAFVHQQKSGSSSGATPVTTGSKSLTTGAKPLTTGAKSLTTGAKSLTTGVKPATTGVKRLTTGRLNNIITTGMKSSTTTAPATTGLASTTGVAAISGTVATSGSVPVATSGSANQDCTLGQMKCASDNTYQTCSFSSVGSTAFGPVQNCPTGLSCHPSGIFIYCY